MTKHREPAGTIKIPEQATDNEKAWELLLDLDDVKWLSNGDKDSIYEFVSGSVARIKESRRPCRTVDKLFNLRECK